MARSSVSAPPIGQVREVAPVRRNLNLNLFLFLLSVKFIFRVIVRELDVDVRHRFLASFARLIR